MNLYFKHQPDLKLMYFDLMNAVSKKWKCVVVEQSEFDADPITAFSRVYGLLKEAVL